MSNPEVVCAQVRAALEHEPRINLHRYPIHLRYEDGILTMDGEVERIVAKKLALELAAGVPDVDGLVDRLRVAPAHAMGDGAIRDHVRDALLQEPAFTTFAITVRDQGQVDTLRPASGTPYGSIEVAVTDGVVTLNGQIPSLSHKRLAGVLAWWVPGSRDVINGLAEDLDPGISLQPLSDGRGFAIGKQGQGPPFQVHEEGAIGMTLLQGELVHWSSICRRRPEPSSPTSPP